MFSRLVRFRSMAGTRGDFSRRFKSCWADGGDHATHNDLPVPEGDWKEYYSRLNMRNNFVFVTGILALAASCYLVFFSGTVNFNATRPKHWKIEGEGEGEDAGEDKC